ncbi:MAG: hypothetical protein WA066_02770 [Candidatus Omnitrophota bacterium]
MRTIGTVLSHNKRMQDFLRSNGFPYAVAKYFNKGSLRGSWRIYSRPAMEKGDNLWNIYEKWSEELAERFNALGFTNLWHKPLDKWDGNGGLFQVFVRGHNEFLKEVKNGR